MNNELIGFGGVFSLLLSPFGSGGRIDREAYEAYVGWQLGFGPDGLFAVCGSSEMRWLELDERIRLARTAVDAAGSATPVVATGNLEDDPSRHPDEIRRLCDVGVSGIVLVPPRHQAGDEAALERYFRELAQAATVPILLYEWPQVEQPHIPPNVFGQLASDGVIAGIKDTTCTIEGVTEKLQVAGRATVFQANTPYLLDSLKLGAGGIMAITSAAFPGLVHALWREWKNGRDVGPIHRELVFLDGLLRSEYPATAKYLVERQGLAFPQTCRWPVSLSREMGKALDVWLEGVTARMEPDAVGGGRL
jgi:4-hydroxy-tetrahydrodipicolinate synthase